MLDWKDFVEGVAAVVVDAALLCVCGTGFCRGCAWTACSSLLKALLVDLGDLQELMCWQRCMQHSMMHAGQHVARTNQLAEMHAASSCMPGGSWLATPWHALHVGITMHACMCHTCACMQEELFSLQLLNAVHAHAAAGRCYRKELAN